MPTPNVPVRKSISAIRKPGLSWSGKKVGRAVAHFRTRRNIRKIIEQLHETHSANGPKSALSKQMDIYLTPVDMRWVREKTRAGKEMNGKTDVEKQRITDELVSLFKKEIQPQYMMVARRVAVSYAARDVGMAREHRSELSKMAAEGARSQAVLDRAKQLLGRKYKAFDKAYARHGRPLFHIADARVKSILYG